MPWTLFDTALGKCGLAWNEVGIVAVQLPEKNDAATEKRLRARAAEVDADAKATSRSTPAWVNDAVALVREHFTGKAKELSHLPIDFARVTDFNAKIYRALQAVPAGKTITYGELARVVGSPGASRAVGRAMATNPYPIFVPCHRVLAAAGKGGFSAFGGVVTKEKILGLEGAPSTQKAVKSLFATATDTSSALPYDIHAARLHLEQADSVLATHLAKTGAFTLSLKETEGTFASLAESIVYQQLNGKAAGTILGRVRALFPRKKLDPRLLLAMDEDDLRAAGLSANKLASLRDLAKRTVDGEIPTLAQLQRMEDDAIVEKLTKVRGIGRWTVEMLLIFRLGRPDVLPVADYGIKKGFALVFHKGKRKEELPTDEDLTKRGERWRPFRSMASWYLWRATDT